MPARTATHDVLCSNSQSARTDFVMVRVRNVHDSHTRPYRNKSSAKFEWVEPEGRLQGLWACGGRETHFFAGCNHPRRTPLATVLYDMYGTHGVPIVLGTAQPKSPPPQKLGVSSPRSCGALRRTSYGKRPRAHCRSLKQDDAPPLGALHADQLALECEVFRARRNGVLGNE